MMADGESFAKTGMNTKLAHIGYEPHGYFGFVNPPVVHASTVLFPNARTMATRDQPYIYATLGTPTSNALCRAVDTLEGSAGTVLVPSGQAAVALPMMAFLAAGDHVLITDCVYAPTRQFADLVLRRMGIEVEYYEPRIGAGIKRLLRSNTKVVFTESPASNTFEVQDIPAISSAAHAANAIVMMDNTWATPLLFTPLDHGVDISVHAATKYPGGHADLLLGMVSANAATWPRLWEMFLALGIPAAPDDSYQVLRGLRTMGVRLAHHQKSAIEIASWLEHQPGIARVLHPALSSHPDHAIWKRDFSGASGVFSMVLASASQAHAFLDALRIFGLGYSWGSYGSLAMQADLADRTVADRAFDGALIRLQIGLEDIEDLKQDLARGLKAAGCAAQPLLDQAVL
ncbi:MAG: cystathionine beta-lyase [Aquamicrobium sp.]|uniref:cystathionine beta-lyase n=1 Tax=Mesorhizobium sp. Pch-S TaxID=2082387 RepID=UPI0010109642|nr:cystathionine beta-lyase [Mesorhizobium sp. Pch-S]MBR2686250.1 cystathionine beta-lyase [Aquamicrobium sp.]QAZ44138.1 cystathionine beta-lyase [Mesorhizobium sp. Pch-S]